MNEIKIVMRLHSRILDSNTILVHLTLDQKMLDRCHLAARMATELEKPESNAGLDCGLARAVITVPALVYDDYALDESLDTDGEYEEEVVDTFPKVNDAPICPRVELEISAPGCEEGRVNTDCVWIQYFPPEGADTFTQPVHSLSEAVSALFLLKQR